MRWADEAIGEFLERLQAAGIADRTVIVVFGDHRAGLQRLSHDSGVINFGTTLAERTLNRRVPLVMWCPSVDFPHGTIDLPVGLVDLPPTIAALLGVDPSDLPWLGRNLFGRPGDGPVVIGNRTWVNGQYIFSVDEGESCFDRVTGHKVAAALCDEGSAAADQLRDAGALILNRDLQQRLRTYLEAEGTARPQ
jgi:phosphoglycerol transferase MdoB-like AlkP superfamily enzyme